MKFTITKLCRGQNCLGIFRYYSGLFRSKFLWMTKLYFNTLKERLEKWKMGMLPSFKYSDQVTFQFKRAFRITLLSLSWSYGTLWSHHTGNECDMMSCSFLSVFPSEWSRKHPISVADHYSMLNISPTHSPFLLAHFKKDEALCGNCFQDW